MKNKSRRNFLGHITTGISAAAFGIDFTLAASSQNRQVLGGARRNTETFSFAIHGGAGTITRALLTAELERDYRTKLTEALTVGYELLNRGAGGLDAIEAAIRIMEDSPLFNAGKGAVFTSAGTNELDASIMDGNTLKAGAVAGLKHIRNPISLARLVMDRSPHVMMTGEGAEAFAKSQGIEFVEQSYFYTERRWSDLQRIKEQERQRENQTPGAAPQKTGNLGSNPVDEKFGTVGAVALDKAGNLSAGTSTGGMTNKRFGRIGDSPIIGAGTYANNQTCAVSATGDGEYFIRAAVAHDISAMMEYGKLPVGKAAAAVIEKVGRLGGTGGVIVLDSRGRVAMPFNTAGMYRGSIGADGKAVVAIYND